MTIWHLRKPIPQDVRRAVLDRARHCCEDCGATVRFELHHVSYQHPYLDQIFGNEKPEDLAALCRNCHHERHMFWGVFYSDPDELAGVEDQYEKWSAE